MKKHYLVYAITLKVARKVIQQMQIVFPNLEEESYRFSRSWYHRPFALGGGRGGGFDSLLENVQRSMQEAASRVSSGSGAGGGFSGSGGGGRGGGGGVAR